MLFDLSFREKEDVDRIEENRERNEREEEEPHTCNFVLFVDFCFCLLLLFVYLFWQSTQCRCGRTLQIILMFQRRST
jgi:hypothetical protein